MRQILFLTAFTFSCLAFAEDAVTVHLQRQKPTADNPNVWVTATDTEQWKASETAIIVCGMWDKHWCQGCTSRVAEMAAPLNKMLVAARNKGVLIIHAPSGTMRTYEETPQRQKLKDYLNKDETVAKLITGWQTQPLDTEKGRTYSIEVIRDGCDCPKACKSSAVWKSEIATVPIEENDLISNSGNEIGAYLKEKGYKNVILCSVATNMCVMGRPCGLRAMVRLGFNTVLMRDMTDTMYSEQGKPCVNHYVGNDLMVGYIEKFVAASILSTDFTGTEPFRFEQDGRRQFYYGIPKGGIFTTEHTE